MHNLVKLGQRLSANALGRGVGNYQLRMCFFELDEPIEQYVKLNIRDFGIVEHMVSVQMETYFFPELLDLFLWLHHLT